MDRLAASKSAPGPKGKARGEDHCAYRGALLGSRASLKPIQGVTSNHLVRFRSTSPRKNLPPSISRKRAEANFLCSFERAFVAGHCQTKQITWRDFALQGYGIPDPLTPERSVRSSDLGARIHSVPRSEQAPRRPARQFKLEPQFGQRRRHGGATAMTWVDGICGENSRKRS